ncbi:helix-turn-helix domain-containing protein [Natronosporangium hydrolyticum]|uniref:Helix-turn-helix domain-containing protein n=1 Tax=Natronosporangium hydrolyticum TaxID=2811111 RepID=A0A895YGD7_9ACTN|nr:helix-turn-helix domain-containing protein [Natronosporangium hydrolyticum]QSB14559.1 helix-turn-helix domain-containing protein [Natronosporangium hydrolyticum]
MTRTSTGRNHAPGDVLLRLLTPAEVARALGCSEWWIKEQARKRRIPFTKTGGAYRFTPEHVHEIVRIFEQRPNEHREPEVTTGRKRRPVVQPVRPLVELRARPPRRARDAA